MIQVLPVPDPLYLYASFSHNTLNFCLVFLPPPLFPDPVAAQVGVYVTAAELSSLERRHLKME